MQLPPNSYLLASGDTGYLAVEGDAPVVTALDLSTGRQYWRLAVSGPPLRVVDLGHGTDAVILRAPATRNGDANRGDETVFVRRSDGRPLGRAPGDALRQVGRVVLMAAAGGTQVSGIDPVTGAAVWRVTLPDQGRVLAGGQADADGFVTAGPDGELILRRVSTGQVRATVPGALTSGSGIRLSAVVGDVLTVGVPGADHSTFTGYDVGGLRRLWSIELPRDSGGRPLDTSLVDLGRCGSADCVADGGGTAVVDPVGGSLRFRTRLNVIGQVKGGAYLAVPYLGRLDSIGRFVTDVLSLDPLSGLTVVTVGGASPVAAVGGGTVPTAVVRRDGPTGTQFYAVRADGSDTGLFTVRETDLGCVQRPPMLVCVSSSGVTRGWEIPGQGG